jgi:hypothetical protein
MSWCQVAFSFSFYPRLLASLIREFQAMAGED